MRIVHWIKDSAYVALVLSKRNVNLLSSQSVTILEEKTNKLLPENELHTSVSQLKVKKNFSMTYEKNRVVSLNNIIDLASITYK